MVEAVRLIQKWFEEKLKVTPGIIAELHTIGSRLIFNPRVHMLVTMGGMNTMGYMQEGARKYANKRFKNTVNYHCLQCKMTEEIPLSVVQDFDAMDDRDLSVPPMFACHECGGEIECLTKVKEYLSIFMRS